MFTPDPLSIGFPTGGDPVLVDISASITTNGMTRLLKQGRKLPHAWLLDGHGTPSDDPAVLSPSPRARSCLGGLDAGHKGYGLALLVEAMTGGLAGFGRADPKQGWGATVWCRYSIPRLSAGRRPSSARCRQSPTPATPIRRARECLPCDFPARGDSRAGASNWANGVALNPEDIAPALKPWAEKLGVELPEAL